MIKAFKLKVVFLTEYRAHKYGYNTDKKGTNIEEDGNKVTSEYLQTLNKDGLNVTVLSTMYFCIMPVCMTIPKCFIPFY